MSVLARNMAKRTASEIQAASNYIDPLSYRLSQASEYEFTLKSKTNPGDQIQIKVERTPQGKVEFVGLPEQFSYYLDTFNDDQKISKPLIIL